MTITVYCPECEAACSEVDPTCPLCGHQLQVLSRGAIAPTVVAARWPSRHTRIAILLCGLLAVAYAVVLYSRSGDGVLTEGDAKEDRIPLVVEVLKIRQSSSMHVTVDIRFTNTCTVDLSYFGVTLELYGDNGKYLGSCKAIAQDVRSGESKIEDTMFVGQAEDIRSYKMTLGNVYAEEYGSVEQVFDLLVNGDLVVGGDD